MMTEDHVFDEDTMMVLLQLKRRWCSCRRNLMKMLKDLRKRMQKIRCSSICYFSRSIIRRYGLKYPITIEELSNVHGVGEGKAKKYGKDFVALIAIMLKIMIYDDQMI